MKLTKQQTSIEYFLTCLDHIAEKAQEAGAVLAALVESKGAGVYAEIIQRRPMISPSVLYALERVGRTQLLPALLFDSSPGARRLLTLPYSMQKDQYDKPVRVVSVKDGKRVVTEKTISQLTPLESRIVIANDHIRTVDEQAKIVMLTAESVKHPAERFIIDKKTGNLTILEQTEFTPSQLQDVYERVTAIAVKSLKTA